MKFKTLFLAAPLLLAPGVLVGQDSGGVTAADLSQPLKDSWPTYNGDYSGKRYSALTQIDQSNVKQLTLAWMTRVTPGAGNASGNARFGRGGERPNIIVGGEGPGDIVIGGGTIKASMLEVDGVLYF